MSTIPSVGAWTRGVGLVLLVLAGGCTTSSTTISVGRAAPAEEVGVAGVPFPECVTDEFAFIGRTSLAAIGLAAIAGGPDANRVGQVWVTAEPVAIPGVQGRDEPLSRMACIEWADGSGMASTIDDAWRPPGDAAVPTAGGGELPVPAIVVAVAIAVLAGASFLAFRRDAA